MACMTLEGATYTLRHWMFGAVMHWDAASMWWVAAGALVAVEMATGTFYLLMLALGCVAAALAAHANLGWSGQLVLAALVGGGAVAGWYLRRQHAPKVTAASADRSGNLDIGERVLVASWRSDGSARVDYRGAQWDARYAGHGEPRAGEHVIHAIEGNRLMLVP